MDITGSYSHISALFLCWDLEMFFVLVKKQVCMSSNLSGSCFVMLHVPDSYNNLFCMQDLKKAILILLEMSDCQMWALGCKQPMRDLYVSRNLF